MVGGVSAQVTGIEIEQSDGQTKKMIVRQHGAADLKRDPHIALHEFNLLQLLRSAGLPVPTPYYVDESGEVLASPYIVIEFIESQQDFTPSELEDYILQLATHLAGIHNVDWQIQDLYFLPLQEKNYTDQLAQRPVFLDESLDEGRIRDALESVWPLPQSNKTVLLHGDFWPGNTLWRGSRLAAIIDWEDAALGDPLADLANSRLEILWAFGMGAMIDFTLQYKSKMKIVDLTNLPYWDLCVALRPASKLSQWGLEVSTEQRMRDRHQWFVNQAFERLSKK